jgi:hypothetical protein
MDGDGNYLIGLADDGDAEEVDCVHVEGDGDDVEGEGGVCHAGDGAGSGQVRRLTTQKYYKTTRIVWLGFTSICTLWHMKDVMGLNANN